MTQNNHFTSTYNCIDCDSCVYCNNCNNCSYCGSCDYCIGCYSSYHSNYLYNCDNSNNSINCNNCNYLHNCYYSNNCYSCNYCDSCDSCNYCTSCYFCKDLKMAEKQLFCTSSEEPKSFRVFNVEISEDEYRKIEKPMIQLEFNIDEDSETVFHTAFKKAWKELTIEQKQQFFDIPHFNWEIFTKITGVEKQ